MANNQGEGTSGLRRSPLRTTDLFSAAVCTGMPTFPGPPPTVAVSTQPIQTMFVSNVQQSGTPAAYHRVQQQMNHITTIPTPIPQMTQQSLFQTPSQVTGQFFQAHTPASSHARPAFPWSGHYPNTTAGSTGATGVAPAAAGIPSGPQFQTYQATYNQNPFQPFGGLNAGAAPFTPGVSAPWINAPAGH